VQESPHIVPPQRPNTDGDEPEERGDDQDIVPTRPDHESNLARDVSSGMMPFRMKTLCALAVVALLGPALAGTSAIAAPPTKKYHFELTAVTPKPEVKPEVAKIATERVEAQIKKAFEATPQLVATLDDAPDPKTAADAYRRYLIKKGIAGSYLVTVEITEASEEITPMEGKTNSQRMAVHVGIHLLGETIPGRTIGFTGDGQATVKQEIGMKLRDKDRTYAWDGAAETAVKSALAEAFAKLAHAKK
jgi:hypothetical protein